MNGNSPVVVAFTKDWDDVPTCTTHVLRHMAKNLPVLWIESIGTRKPRLTAGHDWRRLWRRARRALAGAETKENRLRVLAPLVLPKSDSALGRRLNRQLMAWQIGRALRGLAPRHVEYWCFVPNAVDLLPDAGAGELPEARGRARGGGNVLIYYCVDDWEKFHNLDGNWLSRKEARLVRMADVVFTPSQFLAEKCRRLGAVSVHYVPHGVDYAAFARALAKETPVPEDVAGLPRPVVGFYGNLHAWVDFDLIHALARLRPHWSFVLIGQIYADVSRFNGVANVYFLGRREHAELPAYCKAFDVAMIPYDMRQDRMASVNPVKTKELLAAGVPIVAADVPELRGYGRDVLICHSPAEWLAAIEEQAGRTDRAEISRRVAGEDWGCKVAGMRREVERIWQRQAAVAAGAVSAGRGTDERR